VEAPLSSCPLWRVGCVQCGMRIVRRVAALAAVLAAPVAGRAEVRLVDPRSSAERAEVRLLDRALARPMVIAPVLALAQDRDAASTRQDDDAPPPAPAPAPAPAPGDLDFDLLGEAERPPEAADDPALRRRRKILAVHQGLGLGLVALQLGTTAVGQLNYLDKFGDANTGRYERTHAVLAYTTVAVFAADGLLAVLAPDPPRKVSRGFDRVTLHRIAMFTAAAGIVAQAGLGYYTARREGYLDKQDFGRAHLVVGYVTLAAVAIGVSALVF
jgi:hypothetical protein